MSKKPENIYQSVKEIRCYRDTNQSSNERLKYALVEFET